MAQAENFWGAFLEFPKGGILKIIECVQVNHGKSISSQLKIL
jgi:hypothetical protein